MTKNLIIAATILTSLLIAGLASYAGHVKKLEEKARIAKIEKQVEQLQDIVRRCGAELCIDKDGNYDAIIPMTPAEFEQFKDELRNRKQDIECKDGVCRPKQPTLAPPDACKCGEGCQCKPKPPVSVMSFPSTYPESVLKKEAAK